MRQADGGFKVKRGFQGRAKSLRRQLAGVRRGNKEAVMD
jgi:hypothetical protein